MSNTDTPLSGSMTDTPKFPCRWRTMLIERLEPSRRPKERIPRQSKYSTKRINKE